MFIAAVRVDADRAMVEKGGRVAGNEIGGALDVTAMEILPCRRACAGAACLAAGIEGAAPPDDSHVAKHRFVSTHEQCDCPRAGAGVLGMVDTESVLDREILADEPIAPRQ